MSGKTNRFIGAGTEEMFNAAGIPEWDPKRNLSNKYTTNVNTCYPFPVTEVIIWHETA
jgi:hypothetical protein